MADTDGREPGDVDRARVLGRRLGEVLYDQRPPAGQLFRYVTDALPVRPTWRGMGPDITRTEIDFLEDLARARRLIEYSREFALGGIPVLRRVENDFGEPPLVDFLNPRALRSLLRGRATPENLRQTVRALGETAGVEVRNPRDASIGFMTLFTDSVNVAALATASSGGTTHVNYHVTSQNSGYQLEYYPQYNFTPVVFGSTLTYPVTDYIKTGHYYFQGVDSSNTVHTESRVHFAGRSNTSTVIRAF